jgi:hypothetical protein
MPDQRWTAEEVFRLLAGESSSGERAELSDKTGAGHDDDEASRFAQVVSPTAEIPDEAVEALKLLFPPGQQGPEAAAPPRIQPPSSPSALRQAYRWSAAVLAAFDPAYLTPLDRPAPRGGAVLELAGDLVPSYGTESEQDVRWMLRPEVRRQALGELGGRPALIRALEANPGRPGTMLQQTLEEQIRGTAKPLEQQSLDELACTLQAVRWLQPTELQLPGAAWIHRLMEERRVVAVFEQLAGHFVGRDGELRQLRDYVGVLEPSSKIESARRMLRRWFDQVEKPPIAFYAPGGAGKSTLIAKFLLDHSRVAEERRFPYVYLDFDSPTLVADAPLTILREAARQLAVQYPSGRDSLDEFVATAHDAVLSASPDRGLSAEGLETVRQSAQEERRYEELHLRFAKLVSGIVQRTDSQGSYDVPLLVVTDTYEEVQSRGVEHELRLWILLDALRSDFRSLRVVVFGRAPVERTPTTGQSLNPQLLEELHAGAARGLLREAGVDDPESAQALYEAVGGNPLNLKLAAQVYLKEQEAGSGLTGVEKLDKRRFLRFSVGENVIQGQLYQRTLRHIHDEDVRRLAHPGLVLRRVTPGLIKEVLQGPCGVPVPDDERARQLFEGLRREVALVTLDPDGALHHRPDVRRVMLSLIKRDKPEQVAEINRLAVGYYERNSERLPPAQARAEEVYHRLQLGQPAEEIQQRWMPGIAEYLRGALEELPLTSQPLLASWLGIRLPEDVLKAADTRQWESYTESLAEGLMRQGQFDAALRALTERPRKGWSPDSPLHFVEAQALVLLGRLHEAEAALGRAMQAADRSDSRTRLLNTLLLGAQIADEQRDHARADERLARAQDLAAVLKDPVRQIELALRRLRLRQGDPKMVPDNDLRPRLAHLLEELPAEDWLAQRRLVRQAVLALGFDYPRLLLWLVQRVGAGPYDAKQRQQLAELLAGLAERDEKIWERVQAFARTVRVPMPDVSPASMVRLLQGVERGNRLAEFFEQIIPLVAADPEARQASSSVLPQLFAGPASEEES